MPRLIALAAAVMTLVVPQVAMAATEPPCLTANEFTALATYALPGAIDGTARTCAPALPDDSLRQMADAALTGIAASKIKPGSCHTIDRMIALLAPLPAANTAELIGVLAGLGSKTGEARIGKFSLCKA